MRFTSPALGALLAFTFQAIAAPSSGFGQAPPTTPPADEAASTFAETAGLFGGLQLYNAYLSIGLLADAMAEDLYTLAVANQLLGSVVQPFDRIEKQLDKVSKLKLAKDDAEAIARMKKITVLLRQQGKELELYWDKGLAENSTNYQNARKAAWKELNTLLDLEPAEELLPLPRDITEPKK